MPTGTYDKEKDTIWPFFLNSLNPSTKVRGVLIYPDIITGVRRGNGGILGSRYGTCSRFPGPGSHSLVNYYSVVAGGASVANYRPALRLSWPSEGSSSLTCWVSVSLSENCSTDPFSGVTQISFTYFYTDIVFFFQLWAFTLQIFQNQNHVLKSGRHFQIDNCFYMTYMKMKQMYVWYMIK